MPVARGKFQAGSGVGGFVDGGGGFDGDALDVLRADNGQSVFVRIPRVAVDVWLAGEISLLLQFRDSYGTKELGQ